MGAACGSGRRSKFVNLINCRSSRNDAFRRLRGTLWCTDGVVVLNSSDSVALPFSLSSHSLKSFLFFSFFCHPSFAFAQIECAVFVYTRAPGDSAALVDAVANGIHVRCLGAENH